MDSQDELLRLVSSFREWVENNLDKHQPEQAHVVRLLLIDLHNIATNHPEQAGAALIGAKTVWHMLRKDAWVGFGGRGGRKDRPRTIEGTAKAFDVSKADVDEKMRVFMGHGDSKTKAVKNTARALECSERTVWNKLKENK